MAMARARFIVDIAVLPWRLGYARLALRLSVLKMLIMVRGRLWHALRVRMTQWQLIICIILTPLLVSTRLHAVRVDSPHGSSLERPL